MLKADGSIQTPTPPHDYSRENSPNRKTKPVVEAEASRYHEEDLPSKRRKVNGYMQSSPLAMKNSTEHVSNKGPFLEVSDDDEIISVLSNQVSADTHLSGTHPTLASKLHIAMEGNVSSSDAANPLPIPLFKRESTSIEGNEFKGMDDFVEEEFAEEGEEYLERVWMEKQRQFDMESEDEGPANNQELKGEDGAAEEQTTRNGETATTCPICGGSFDGFTNQVGLIRSW